MKFPNLQESWLPTTRVSSPKVVSKDISSTLWGGYLIPIPHPTHVLKTHLSLNFAKFVGFESIETREKVLKASIFFASNVFQKLGVSMVRGDLKPNR